MLAEVNEVVGRRGLTLCQVETAKNNLSAGVYSPEQAALVTALVEQSGLLPVIRANNAQLRELAAQILKREGSLATG